MDVAPLHTAPLAATPAPAPGSAEIQAENRQLIQAVHAINAAELFGEDSELTYVLKRGTGRAAVRLVRRKSRDLIRQIPSEEVLSLAADAGRDEG
ncbi:MAG TPA: flagellar protein FlaG [Bryobacteraceae bacterium]|nr:flagellar protein FlaG [Bryobacteraceae bacterium]